MKMKRANINGGHPETLAARGPERLAAGGARWRQRDRLAALHLEQHHEPGEHQDGDEEEEIVADDGADDGHLPAGGGKDSVFREFVQAGNQKLGGDKKENDGCDFEELLQVDLDAAFDEHHTEKNRNPYAQHGADETEQLARVQRDGGEDQNGFDALAQHHQEDEQEEADPGVVAGEQADFAFDLALELAAGLHHEDDHGHDEDGGDQHDPAFENVLVPIQAGEQDSNADRSGKGGGEGGIDGFAQIVAADLCQVREGDADDESGFDAFAESDDECLQHARKCTCPKLKMNFNFNMDRIRCGAGGGQRWRSRVVVMWLTRKDIAGGHKRARSSRLLPGVPIRCPWKTLNHRGHRGARRTSSEVPSESRTEIHELTGQRMRKNFCAGPSSGNISSSAKNSCECTHLRLPRNLTGCFR